MNETKKFPLPIDIVDPAFIYKIAKDELEEIPYDKFDKEVKIGFFEVGLEGGGIFYLSFVETEHAEAYVRVRPAIEWWMKKKNPELGPVGLRYKDTTEDRLQRLLYSKQLLKHKYDVKFSFSTKYFTYMILEHTPECIEECDVR